jgi:hypothetical protein
MRMFRAENCICHTEVQNAKEFEAIRDFFFVCDVRMEKDIHILSISKLLQF